ncbi:MAG TPA: VWA domain-containing protein [Vicinamibacterales bacterium]|nr:VWA domain-containing protein [Vicinamibacterales bacterium]
MFRLLTTAAIAAVMCAVAGAQQQQPTFRGGADTVRVFVTVTDRDGRLVTDLTEDKFEVRDEGKPQPITIFDNSPKPIQLIVMLDVSGSMEGNLPLLRTAARQLFLRLGPADVARVGTFGNEIVISPEFTGDLTALSDALPATIESRAPTPLWRAVDDAMKGFDATSDRRKVVLVLSDGHDGGPQLGKRFISQGDVILTAQREDVMVYAIGLHSRFSRPPQVGIGRGGLSAALRADDPDPGLARAAIETGGGYLEVEPRDDLGAAFARVADELHSQYLLGFEPSKRDGKKHNIQVRVADRGLEPRARKSYIAPK